MFGESDSESPRVPSPWDPVLASSLDPHGKVYYSPDVKLMPKLVAEVEEGNIEYKLHLIEPSPARFSRLVTQLKWRLLEGGGEAFYELGVADSGVLVGLSADDLARTLETLSAMADEIGAHVVVVKQIEVVGRGARAEDAREFSKKRKDKDKDKERAVAKAKAKDLAAVDLAHASVVASSYGSASSGAASSISSTSSSRAYSDSDIPALSFSSSPSPPSRTAPTPADLDELPAIFVMDTEPQVPPSAPIPVQRTKSEKRRFTRDLRRAQRHAALVAPEAALVDALGALELGEPEKEKLSEPVVEAKKDDNPEFTRFIVEAMVVRELDLEEAFLDFSRM
ncbi:hypothetical protein FA95DRAFT_1599425 [Auriscalpium vulgare]|uniref:Uncharacterized protein n=1 Tax=Auriscalpium vulgare TaxID=40419 RepID=A0ACB8RA23_9AGAM|nr:hypothetical protein FA95DRAFT_1599425 [Auriscalpium vulgare]